MAKRNETGKDGESVARAFLEKQGYNAYVRFFNLELPVRFDIITVIKKGEESEIDHIEDAFYAPCRK